MPGTRLIDHREIARRVELDGLDATMVHLSEALEAKLLAPKDFSLKELAESFCGREWVDNLHPKRGRFSGRAILEADAAAVGYSSFSNITGQILFTEVKQAYEAEEFVFSKIVPEKSSDILDMEKVPGLSEIGDEAEIVQEGAQYPYVGFSEDYIEIAAKQKRGHICAVTKEMVFGDRTGLALERAKGVGHFLGLNKEKRVIDCVIDENGGAKSAALGGHRYHWKGTSYGTYQTTTPWVNVKTSNGLADWTDVDNAWQILAAMVDPYTGEPILIQPKDLIVTSQNVWIASRILAATEVRAGDITTGSGNQMISGNPINTVVGKLNLVSSRLLTARAATDTDWWLGNLAEAFRYYANWGLSIEEAPSNSRDAFERDIVMQVKCSERGTAATVEPRLMVENQQ